MWKTKQKQMPEFLSCTNISSWKKEFWRAEEKEQTIILFFLTANNTHDIHDK